MTIIEKLSPYSNFELKQEIRRRIVKEDYILISTIITATCGYYKVKEKSLYTSGTGPKDVRRAKRALCYIFHHVQNRTCVEVGVIMKRVHSSVTVSSNKARGMLEDPAYRKEIDLLLNRIKSYREFNFTR